MRITYDTLTFDDVLLLPGYSEILPAQAVLTTQLTRHITLNIPLLSACMDTVTEAAMAIALAEAGGIGVLHKNMPAHLQADEVRKVKKFESGVVKDPITVGPHTTLAEIKRIRETHQISGMPVVDQGKVVGIITNRDMRFEDNLQRQVAELMTPKKRLVTVSEHTTQQQAIQLFQQHRIEKLLVVDEQFVLKGMMTVKDILRAEQHPHACKDTCGQLRVAAAVGVNEAEQDRVKALVTAGVDLLVVDTAHGHSKRVLDQVRWIKQHYPSVEVMGGNIATAEAAKALRKAGVDAVKVGIGPGSICTTRMIAGVGVPQISAIVNVANALKGSLPVISDGGIRFSGDIGKALAAGANAVMIGNLLAGTKESPGEIVLYQGRSYKAYRGMGSVGAMSQRHGSSDRYFQSQASGTQKLVPEGIEGRVPYKGKASTVIHQLMGGLRSCMGYTGCVDIPALQRDAHFIKISSASVRESHVHDVIITKEAPNYQVD